MNDEMRPVFVEVTTKHVVWVYADDDAEALRTVSLTPCYEMVKDGETDVATWSQASLPDGQGDWEEVYELSYGGGYTGVQYDAHVDAHRTELHRRQWEARKAACAAAGHPDVKVYAGETWCQGCSEYLPAGAIVGGAS